jgi:hypothetical protein
MSRTGQLETFGSAARKHPESGHPVGVLSSDFTSIGLRGDPVMDRPLLQRG